MLSRKQKNTYSAIIICASAIVLQTSFQLFAIHLDISTFVVTAWFTFFAFPILTVILLKIPLRNVGIQWGTIPRNKLLILSTVLLLLAITYSSFLPVSREYYSARVPENNVILYLMIVYTILYSAEEFFFRGFILFGLEPWLGKFTIIAQTIPFVLFHIGKPPIEILLSIPAGIIFGKIALDSRSFIIPFLIHWSLGIGIIFMLSIK